MKRYGDLKGDTHQQNHREQKDAPSHANQPRNGRPNKACEGENQSKSRH
jgi:hypothetical protein